MRIFIIALLAFSIAGCATQRREKVEAALNSWLGAPISRYVERNGYQTREFMAPNGNKVYVFSWSRNYTTPMQIQCNTDGSCYTIGGHNRQIGCNKYLEVDSDGIIRHWRYEGNKCY